MINNVAIVSDVQRSDSVIQIVELIHVSLFKLFSHLYDPVSSLLGIYLQKNMV